jgi:hypothetical protein
MDTILAVTFCSDGYIAIDSAGVFMLKSSYGHKPSLTLQLSDAARDVQLSTYLTIVNPEGTEFTIYNKQTLSPTVIQLDGSSNTLLSCLFHERYIVMFI